MLKFKIEETKNSDQYLKTILFSLFTLFVFYARNDVVYLQQVLGAIQVIRDTFGEGVTTVSPKDTWEREGVDQNVT